MEPIKRECNLLPWQIESDVRVHIQYDEKFEFLQGLRIYPSPDTHLLLERTLSRQYRPPKKSTSIFFGSFFFFPRNREMSHVPYFRSRWPASAPATTPTCGGSAGM